MKTQLTPSTGCHRTSLRSGLRIVTFVALLALIGIPLFSSPSASSSRQRRGVGTASIQTKAGVSRRLPREATRISDQILTKSFPLVSSLLPVLPQAGESITTFDETCTTPTTSFDLGQKVCAIISGAALGDPDRAARRLAWVSPYGSVVQGAEIIADPQTGFYQIPTSATQTFTDSGLGTFTVDNRGKWRIYISSNADNSLRTETTFTVHDPAKAFVDLHIDQAAGSEVTPGSSGVFEIYVNNFGPNAATSVVITDTIPANTTFTSAIEEAGGPGFSCGTPNLGVFTCTLASLPADSTAHISFNYSVDSGTTAGTVLANVASISSSATPCSPDSTCEIVPDDNSSTGTDIVPAEVGSPTCTLDCPNNITVTANTSENDVAGAFVTYSAAQPTGSCGAVSNSPASGSFFPVGNNTVTSTSDTSDTCTFVVTVLPPDTAPPTISCPGDKTVAAPSGSSEATVNPGTPTTNPSTGVTVTAVRSDEVDNCDPGPCPPKALTDPYPIGVTLITWTVKDSTAQTASCTQRITVTSSDCGTDTQPPTITAPPAVTAYTGSGSTTCGVALSPSDNELGSPEASDNCSVTVTSDIPPGGLFPVGTTTVHYTATDAAGNTATATQVVTVIDNTLPNISAPGDASYTCPEQVPAGNPSQAHGTDPNLPDGGPVTDNCGTPTVTVGDSSAGAGTPANPRIITRTFTATDSHGNTASAVQTITVTDGTAPTITAPANVSANTGPGATSCDTVISNATLGTASAQDNCAGVTVSRSPSGNTFPVGNTTVTWTATDWAGNTATATQTVTVVDNTVPIVTAPANVTAYTGAGATSCGTVVSDATLSTATATDNCPGVGAISRTGVPSGNNFPVGNTTVTYSVTDAHGNSSSANQTVTVIDNTAPVISCPANIVIEPTCPTGAIATYATPTATDNCAVQSVTRNAGSLASGSVFPVGTSTVTHTATDIYGNQSSCSFTVTVLTPQAVIQNLIASVNASSLTGTQKNGLLAKLNAALSAINSGQQNVACNKLSDFVNNVGTLISHGDISAAQGNAWISSANHVRNNIGCTNLPCS